MVLCLLLSAWCFAPPGSGRGHNPSRAHRSREVLINPKPGVDINTIARRYGLSPVARVNGTTIWRVSFGSFQQPETALLNLLDADRDVDFTELNYILNSPEPVVAYQESVAFVDRENPPFVDQSSPPLYYQQRAYSQVWADQAAPYATGQDIIVAVVDTGIASQHPALANRIAPGGWDFVREGPNPVDELGGQASGHGTFVAGIIALVAPGAKVLPLRALDSAGVGDVFKVASAISRAVDQRARIINLSIGLTFPSPAIDTAIERAYQAGAVLIAAAGNNNTSQPEYIASNSHVIGVTAVDDNDVKASFSNYGAYLRVSAPGVRIYSTYPNDRFATWSGTSFSAAFVSGQAALLLSLRPDLNADLAGLLVGDWSADNIDDLNPLYRAVLGRGRINCLIAAYIASLEW